MAEPPFALPELGRSLRALGALRDAGDERAHSAVFAPLLEARGVAASARGAEAMFDALRGAPLAAQIARLVEEAARNGVRDAAFARARTAQARELLEPLLNSLAELDSYNPSIRMNGYNEYGGVSRRNESGEAGRSAEPAGSGHHRAFVEQLRLVFAAADTACGQLSRLLANATAHETGWTRRSARS